MALTKLAKAGLDSRQIVVSGPEFVHIDKGNARRGFMLPVFTVQGAATISNQREAEMAIVYGVGPKRVLVVVSCIWQGSHEYISGILSLPDCRYVRSNRIYIEAAAGALTQDHKVALISAETGVGKTLGYLVPALLILLKNPEAKFVIATNSHALMHQIFRSDRLLEQIAEQCGIKVTFPGLWGKQITYPRRKYVDCYSWTNLPIWIRLRSLKNSLTGQNLWLSLKKSMVNCQRRSRQRWSPTPSGMIYRTLMIFA
nr:DinG family ATP-dependent helicase YoaA [Klebsiella pneumoniae]